MFFCLNKRDLYKYLAQECPHIVVGMVFISPHCGHVAWFRLVLVSQSLYIPFRVYIMRIFIFLVLFEYRYLKTFVFYIIQVCIIMLEPVFVGKITLVLIWYSDGADPKDGFCTHRILSSGDIHQVSIFLLLVKFWYWSSVFFDAVVDIGY